MNGSGSPPGPPPTPDDQLEDLLTGHASARFRFLDVRQADEWRRERLAYGVNIPLERLSDEAARTFAKDTDLVVYGSDDASTQAAKGVLRTLGFRHVLTIPGGFDWFRSRWTWRIDRGPD